MKKILLVITMFFVALAGSVYGQTKVVQGVVKDDKETIIGASVIEKDVPTNGVVTNVDGKFKITLRGKSHILIVRAIGYTAKEVNASSSDNLVIRLESDVKGLQEVVVVGYGTTKKATLTGAVSSVSGDVIRQNPSASLQNTLAGRLPGFSSQQSSGQPGSDGAAFYIRGTSSYTGSNQPLIIVDDIEFTYAQFARLDPNEIESISILKDASTTAVYGIKGANGVVLVTTRRGKAGPPQITYRGEYSLTQPTKIPKFLDAYQSALLVNQAAANDGIAAPFSAADINHWRTGDDPYGHPNVDWYNVLFRNTSYQLRNNFDIQGGSDKVRYFVSLGALKQNGMLNDFGKDQEVDNNFFYNRYNYRSNLDFKPNKTLNVKIDLYGNIGEQNNPNVPNINGITNIFYIYQSYLSLSPFAYPIYNPNGSYGIGSLQNGRYVTPNIVEALTLGGYSRNVENNMNLNGSATQRLDFITKGLSVRGAIAYGSSYTYTRSLTRGTFPAYIYDETNNTYTLQNSNVSRVGFYSLGYSAGNTVRIINPQASLNYDNNFGVNHVYGLVLYNQRTLLSRTDPNNGSRTLNFIPANSLGWTGRLGYDYKSKYGVEFDGAYNGTDAFDASHRYGFFPAVSAFYNLAEEPFFKNNINFVDRLKFRASYGTVGSDDLGSYQYAYIQTYSQSGSANFGTSSNSYPAIYEGRLGNNDVTWERENKLDVGMELSLFKNRFTATFDYFNNNRYDILTTRGTVSSVLGVGLPPVNLGKTTNRGFEIEAAYNDHIGKDFTYKIGGNISVAKNKIVYQDEPAPLPNAPYQLYTGNPINTPLQYHFIGFYSAADLSDPTVAKPTTGVKAGDLKYADLNGDGVIDASDRSYFGYSNLPNTILGFNLNTSYKNLSLSVFFQGALNFNVAGVRESIQAFGSNFLPIHQQSWTPQLGDAAKYPILSSAPDAISNPTTPSDFWNVRGDYLRLKSVELSYTLPKAWVAKLRMQTVRFYTNGTNLITWTKLGSLYPYDPEISTNNTNTNYPPQKMYNFGVSITF